MAATTHTGSSAVTSADPGQPALRALITGGIGGIGHAIAARLLGAGGRVVLAGRDEARLAAAASGLGPRVGWQRADMTVPARVRDCVETAAANMGGLDVLVTGQVLHINGGWWFGT